VEVAKILEIVYQIQGAADPNHPQTLASLKERMQEIWEQACAVMERTGYRPDLVTAT
jgi:hypothetical protein